MNDPAGQMQGEILVSIVILNYRRRDALVRSLDSALSQEYRRLEIILVDNGSQDGVAEFLAEHAPDVRLISLPCNLGPCGGRNAGIREARGEVIITIDNDVYLDSPFEVSKVVQKFAERPDVHLLAFRVIDADTGMLRVREWCHPRPWLDASDTEFESNFFPEGASAFRREVFENAGLYYEPLFIGVEGHDLALRTLDRGYKILYTPRVRARHLMSPAARTSNRPYYFYTRNYIWIARKDYRWLAAVKFLIPKLLMMLYFTLRARHYRAFLRGIRDGLAGWRQMGRDRTPISAATERYLGKLESDRPNLVVRLSRHRLEPQI